MAMMVMSCWLLGCGGETLPSARMRAMEDAGIEDAAPDVVYPEPRPRRENRYDCTHPPKCPPAQPGETLQLACGTFGGSAWCCFPTCE